MADNKLSEGRFFKADDFYAYKCECGDGTTTIYSNNANCCNGCPPSGVAGGFSGLGKSRGFRNMSGSLSKLSAKNLIVYSLIGFGAFFIYKKFLR